jgi:hypothetical protein
VNDRVVMGMPARNTKRIPVKVARSGIAGPAVPMAPPPAALRNQRFQARPDSIIDRACDMPDRTKRPLGTRGPLLSFETCSKDFTSIIDMHCDARAEVLAALRELYDGRWDRSVGAEGGRTLTWEGRFGLIAGCTTAIDSAHSVISIMGRGRARARDRGNCRAVRNGD